MNNIFVQWLTKGLTKPGKTQKGLADRLSIHQTQISKIMNGTRSIKLDELPAMSDYIGEALPIFETGFIDFVDSDQSTNEVASLLTERGEIDHEILELSYKEAAKVQELLLGGPGSSESLLATATAIYRARMSINRKQD